MRFYIQGRPSIESKVSPSRNRVCDVVVLAGLGLSARPADGELQAVGQLPIAVGADGPLRVAVRGGGQSDRHVRGLLMPLESGLTTISHRRFLPGLDHPPPLRCAGGWTTSYRRQMAPCASHREVIVTSPLEWSTISHRTSVTEPGS